MVRALIFTVLCILSYTNAFAWQLKGRVIDSENEPVPYANVYVENTTFGVVTNIKGEFFMELKNGTYSIIVSCMGFKHASVEVEINNQHKVIEIRMEEDGVELETVELTAGRKDPAYAIMKEVIANKRNFIKQFDSYQCETYLKLSLEVDSLKKKKPVDEKIDVPDTTVVTEQVRIPMGGNPVKERQKLNFIESNSTTYYQYPNTYKSVVHAYRDMTEKRGGGTSMEWSDEGMEVRTYQGEADNPYLFYEDISDADFNFYENLLTVLDIGEKPFISPLSSTSWQLTYKYHLEESFQENGRVIHKIQVTPRNPVGPFFEGHIFIVDKEWAIKAVNLQISEGGMTYFNYFQVVHDYTRTDDNRWVLSREEYYYNVKDGKTRYYGNTIAMHKDYQLDIEHPKNFFRNEIRRVEDDALDKDSLYWNDIRPITLKKAEIDFIRRQDSIIAYHKSDEYLDEQDSIYNHLSIWDFLLNGVGFRSRKHGMEYFFYPLISQPRPFGVGGYRHALGGFISKEFENYSKLTLSGEADYGFVNKDLRGHAKVSYKYNPKKFGSAYIKYGNVYSMVNTNTSFTSILSRANFVNKVYYGAGHEIEVMNGVMLNLGAEFADRKPIDSLNLNTDILAEIPGNPFSFSVYREALISAEVKWVPFQKYKMEPRRKVIVGSSWPTFRFKYKKAIPGIFNSQINYDYIEAGVEGVFRPGTMGTSRIQGRAGVYLQQNKIALTDSVFFRGYDPYYFANPLQYFQLLDSTYATSSPFIEGHFLHDFNGTLIQKIPLLKHTPLQTAFGGGILVMADRSFFHSEIFGGLQLPFRIKKQRFKIGAYYVTSYGNNGKSLDYMWKFGISFYNSYKNQWEY